MQRPDSSSPGKETEGRVQRPTTSKETRKLMKAKLEDVHRFQEELCLVCGALGHKKVDCPKRKN